MDKNFDNKWGYDHLLRKCYELAVDSPDPSTQNGAIILNNAGEVVGYGINKFPKYVQETPDRWERPKKYHFIEHAERNAIYDVSRQRLVTPKMTMVCPWAACSDCARAMIEIGITRLVTHKPVHDLPSMRWMESIDYAFQMFNEVGLEVIFYDEPVGSVPIRVNGEVLTF